MSVRQHLIQCSREDCIHELGATLDLRTPKSKRVALVAHAAGGICDRSRWPAKDEMVKRLEALVLPEDWAMTRKNLLESWGMNMGCCWVHQQDPFDMHSLLQRELEMIRNVRANMEGKLKTCPVEKRAALQKRVAEYRTCERFVEDLLPTFPRPEDLMMQPLDSGALTTSKDTLDLELDFDFPLNVDVRPVKRRKVDAPVPSTPAHTEARKHLKGKSKYGDIVRQMLKEEQGYHFNRKEISKLLDGKKFNNAQMLEELQHVPVGLVAK